VLLVHGTNDETVPVSEAQEIFARRRDERVRLLLIPGSHDQYGEMERHFETVIDFLDTATRPLADRHGKGPSLPTTGDAR
jgi:fermentation-respiration switch protein FrsA (DUF1100 family)